MPSPIWPSSKIAVEDAMKQLLDRKTAGHQLRVALACMREQMNDNPSLTSQLFEPVQKLIERVRSWVRYTVRTVDSIFEGHQVPGIEITTLGTITKSDQPGAKSLDEELQGAERVVSDVCDQIDYMTRDVSYGLSTSAYQEALRGAKSAIPNIFIVHGHDLLLLKEIVSVLDRLCLNPIVLKNLDNRGRTIIEKFEEEVEKCDYVIVLLTGDDEARSSRAQNKTDGWKNRARQNVIFELGFFVGRLGRSKVAVVSKEHEIEIPSDIGGLATIVAQDSGDWKRKLANELIGAGMNVDLRRLAVLE